MSQSDVLDLWRRSRPGSRRERSALGRVRPRARTAGATHPDPRTKPGTPAAEHRGFVGEVESCAHEALGLGRKALSFARKHPKRFAHKAPSFARKVKSFARAPKRFAHKAPSFARKAKSLAHGPKSLAAKATGLAREVPEPDCRAKSPAREAPRLGREARRVGAEAEGLEAGARGLGREAWHPGEPARRKAGDGRATAAALLRRLAATSLGLCVVTTRYAFPDLRAYWQTTAPMHELPRLSTAAGVKLLRTIGVKTGSQAEFEKLVEDVDGHALTLQILGQFLVRAFHGDIRRRDRIRFEKADAKIQGGHAFRAVEAYVKWMEDDSDEARREVALLKLLGLFDRPATADCVAALRQAPAIPGLTEPLVGLAEDDWEFSLTALRDAKLLMVNREEGSGVLLALDAHPLLREYFARLRAPAAARGLARRPPAALRTPLRDHEGQSRRQTRRPPTALPSGGPRLPGGVAAGGVREGLPRPHPARPRSLQHAQTRRVRFRLGSRRLLLRDPVQPRLARAHGNLASLAAEPSRLPPARLGPADRGSRADADWAGYVRESQGAEERRSPR